MRQRTKKFPLCRRHEILSRSQNGKDIVNTARLWAVLGERRYQRCRHLFFYEGNYPRPDEVERFLERELKK